MNSAAAAAASSSADSADPIVAEFPVYLSQDLNHSLYLLHSPLRPFDRPYARDHAAIAAFLVKPQQKLVQISYELPDSPSHFNASHYYSKFVNRELKLVGRFIPPKTNYAVGVFHSGAVHLTPIHAVVKLKPDFSHVDLAESESKAEIERLAAEQNAEKERAAENFNSDDEENAMNESGMDEAADEAGKSMADGDIKPLMMKFKKAETERSAAYKARSFAYLKAAADAEPFVSLQVHNADSIETRLEFDRLMAKSTQPIPFNVPPHHYLEFLNPKPIEEFPAAPTHTQNQSVRPTASILSPSPASQAQSHNRRLLMFERLLELIKNAKIVQFSHVVRHLNLQFPPDIHDCLTILERNCFIIHGCFIIKSMYLFSNSIIDHAANRLASNLNPSHFTFSSLQNRKIPDRLEMCRDYLITQLWRNPVVEREKLNQIMQLEVEQMNELLEELCAPTEILRPLVSRVPGAASIPRLAWRLKFPRDENFLKAFPQYQNIHNESLMETETRVKWNLESHTEIKAIKPEKMNTTTLVNENQNNQNANQYATNHTTTASSTASNSATSSSSSSTPVSSVPSLILQWVEDYYRDNGVVSYNYLWRNFVRDSQSAAYSSFTSITPAQFAVLLKQTGLEIRPPSSDSNPSNSNSNSLFVKKSLNNPQIDQYRSIIASLFAVHRSVKKTDVQSAILAQYGEEIPDNLYRKVMKEFANFDKSGNWQLKSGEGNAT